MLQSPPAPCPKTEPNSEKGQKVPQLPHPLLEVVRRGGHEQVDGVADDALQVVPGHAVVMLEVADHRLDACSSAELLPGLSSLVGRVALLGAAWNQDISVTDLLASPVAPVADSRFWTGLRDLPDLLQDLGQRMPVKDVLLEAHGPHDDSCGLSPGDGGLAPELVFLVLFALADAQDIRLMQAVNLVLVRSFLGMDSAEEQKVILVPCQSFPGQFALNLADQDASHGPDALDGLATLESLAEKTGQLPAEASSQPDPLGFGDGPASFDDLGQKLHVRGEGDVLLLDRRVHGDFALRGLLPVQAHRGFENQPGPILTYALAEIDQIRGVARKFPLEMRLAAEGLVVRISDPGLDDALIAQVFKLLEDHEPDHKPDRLGWPAMLAVERRKFLLEPFPGNDRCELEQGILGVELVDEILVEEIALVLSGWFGLHQHPRLGDSATGFLQNHCSFWSRMIH